MTKYISSLALAVFLLIGCSRDSSIDRVQLNAIHDLVRGAKKPSEVELNDREVIENSRAYAKRLSGYLALPENFDLNFLLGKVYYQWGYFDQALIYLGNVRSPRSRNVEVAATDYLLFSAALGGKPKTIDGLGESTNAMLSKRTFFRLAAGKCDGLQMAVADLAVSSKGNVVNRSLDYIEFLCRWAAMKCPGNPEYMESQLLVPALRAVTAGAEWPDFLEDLKAGKILPIRQVLIDDFLSICESAVRVSIKANNGKMTYRWSSYLKDLRTVLYDQKMRTFERLELRSN